MYTESQIICYDTIINSILLNIMFIILGITREGNRILYSIDVEDKKEQMVTANFLIRYVDILIDFLECKMEWVDPYDDVPEESNDNLEYSESCDGIAEEIICKKFRIIQFL